MPIQPAWTTFRAMDELVADGKETVMVEKAKKPVSVMSSEDEAEQEQRQQMDQFWRAVESIRERNADNDPDEGLRFVTEVVEEVRQEHYERKQREARERR